MENHVLLSPTPEITVDEKTHPLQRLSISVAFALVKLITTIGTGTAIKAVQEIIASLQEDELNDTEAVQEDEKKKDKTKAIAAAAVILNNIGNAEKEFNTLGGKLLGIKTEEFAVLPFDVLPQLFLAIKEHPDLKNFSKSVEGLLKVQK